MYKYIVPLDIETTGLDSKKDSIIEIGAVVFSNSKEIRSFSSTIYYGTPLPDFIRKLTGIEEEELLKSPPLEEVIEKFKEFLPPYDETIIIGHNINFDISFIKEVFPEIGHYQIIDTLTLSRIAYPHSQYHSLEFLIHKFKIKTDHHRAENDARTSYVVYERCREEIKKYPDNILEKWEELSLDDSYKWFFSHIRPGEGTKKLPIRDNKVVKDGKVDISTEKLFEEISSRFPHYEKRDSQIEFAKEIEEIMENGGILLAEAGTGTGKSFGYLLPAIVQANKYGKRVIVSTGTKALQDQLFNKDIVEIKEYTSANLRVCLIKGRENYVCKLRIEEVLRKTGKFINDKNEYYAVFPLYYWIEKTITGDLSELGLSGLSRFTRKYISAASSSSCGNCKYKNECFLFRARELAENFPIVVSNTSLTLIDSEQGFKILGLPDILIIDEGHKIEDIGTEQWKSSFNADAMLIWNNVFYTKARRLISGNLSDIIEIEKRIKKVISSLTLWKEDFLKNKLGNLRNKDSGGNVRDEYNPLEEVFEPLTGIYRDIEDISILLKEIDDNNQVLKIAHDELEDILNNLEGVITSDENRIYWFEGSTNSEGKVVLNSAPLNIGYQLEKYLYNAIPSIIITSATLTIENDFSFFKEITGLFHRDDVVEKQFVSPFNYDSQMEIVVVDDMPNPRDKDYRDTILNIVKEILNYDKGSLILATGYDIIKSIEDGIGRINNRHIMYQRRGSNTNAMMEMFREDRNSVLIGTATFWEGIDVRGESLEILFITKLPFDVPTDPVIKARGRFIGDSFNRYMVPRAVIKLRQGSGRLIRSQKDRGILIIGDSRILRNSYGTRFLNSLPTSYRIISYKELGYYIDQIFYPQKSDNE